MATSRPIVVSVRDFALPVPRVGSIETHSGFGRTPDEGQLIHLAVQESRAKAYPEYRSEVFVREELERDGYRFQVTGRIDGLFEARGGKPARIEEIKTAFQMDDLAKKLRAGPDTHPYCLQLKTYGYFYWRQHAELPKLSFHLVSTRNHETRDVPLALDVETYEAWLELRLAELVLDAKRAEARAKRRRKTAAAFRFPFDNPRPGQVELIDTVEKSLAAKRRQLIQAPTGLGKTVGVLYPSLKEALSRGQSVVYVTPKNSQHAVAEDAVTRFQETGAKVRSLTITAKSKICFKAEPLCNPDFCEYAKDHYTKVAAADLPAALAKKRKLTSRVFRALGEAHQVCPFELQLEAAKDADTIICDYNYVFSPRSSLGRLTTATLGEKGSPNLVVDEAHNLPARGMDYYSPSLSSVVLDRLKPFAGELPERFAKEAVRLIDDGIETILSCKPEGETPRARIEAPVEPFLEHESRLRAFLTRYLESDVEIRPRDVVLRLANYWSEFTAALEFVSEPRTARPEFFTTFHSHPPHGTVRITCCDASEFLKASYDDYEHVVAFSATLKPFDYYAKLSGLDPQGVGTAEFASPFPKARRKLLIIPQISTKYGDRDRNYPKIAEGISRIAGVRPGNYFAFFPSFEFLEKVLARFSPPSGFTILRQEREMRAPAVEAVIEHLRGRSAPTIVFAVQGGVFSEGVDYPGETVIGAFVVGPPLPVFDLEREGMREYYEKHYGSGFEYAYAFPAMAKAVQAAGRVIRSETDRGVIVLMDGRFLAPSYTRSMPTDWFEASPSELVSDGILREVRAFWEADAP